MALLATLQGHFSTVWGCSFNPDSSLLASCASDESVCLWNVAARQAIVKFSSHSGVVHSCAFSCDGQYLASCSWDKTILVRDSCLSFQVIQSLQGHQYGISGLDFSPKESNILATCSWDQNICLWNVVPNPNAVQLAEKSMEETTKRDSWYGPEDENAIACLTGETANQSNCLLSCLKGHRNPVVACSFLADGTTLASCSWDRTVRLWDLQQAECRGVLDAHTDVVWSVRNHPQEPHLLASCSRDRQVIVWDCRTGGRVAQFGDSADEVNTVSFSPNGMHLVSGSTNGCLHAWDLRSPQNRPLAQVVHHRGVYGSRFSADGSILATTSSDTSVKLWNFAILVGQGVDDLAANLAAVSLGASS